MLAASANSPDVNVQLNAARFLSVEHPEAGEELLAGVLEREASNRRIATNLGFLYAMDWLGLAPFGAGRSASDRERLLSRARGELDRSDNPLVLGGAATAIRNLFMRTEAARTPEGSNVPFEYASALMARARQLGPDEPALQGPMPLIKEFEEFRNWGWSNEGVKSELRDGPDGSVLRVEPSVQAAKLNDKPEPVYPELARQARIQGVVRFDVVVGADGAVENATLIYGHPLLAPAAIEALRRYRYSPTHLNGKPVKVVTRADIPFTLR